MFFALCQCEIFIPHGRSLKGKRAVVKSIKERLRSRFHASVAEVGFQDLHQRAALGIALVGRSPQALEDALGAMRRLVEDESRCTITAWETRVEPFRGAARAPVDATLSLRPASGPCHAPAGASPPEASIEAPSASPPEASIEENSWEDVDEDDELYGPHWDNDRPGPDPS